MDELDLIVVDGPNLYNSVARFITKETQQATARDIFRLVANLDSRETALYMTSIDMVADDATTFPLLLSFT
jgi:hypothetical protein